MAQPDRLRGLFRSSGLLLGVALAVTPGSAFAAAQAQLVHCGDETCLRLSGHRPDPAMAVRVSGHDLPVEGGHAWRATLPLTTARDWANASGTLMRLSLADARTGNQSSEDVAMPPGALGRRTEIASLVVRAH
jgi:hypothetical protein